MAAAPPRTRARSHDASCAYRSPLAWIVLLGTLAIGLSSDLGSKHWTFAAVAPKPVLLDRAALAAQPRLDPVPDHEPLVAIPRVLQLRLVINRGAVFGLGANQRTFFIVFTLVALLGGIWVFRRLTAADAYAAHLAVGLVLAGGIGNLHDRIVFGAVRDFIQVLPGYDLPKGWEWPGGNQEMFPWVFNLADVFLLVGMVMLMTYLNRRKRQRAAARAAAAGAEEPGLEAAS